MKILFAADVPPDPNSGAAGTELQTILGLRALGHEVDEIWADALPRRIRHGNLHYLLELPRAYRSVIRRRWMTHRYDILHVNQGHAFLAARDHLRSGRPGAFVVRSHGLDDHMERVLRPWRRRLGIRSRHSAMELPGRVLDTLLDRHMRLATRYADGFIVSSSLDRDYLIRAHGMDPDRVAAIPQAPAEAFCRSPAPGMTEERLSKLLYVAGFGYFKGPHAVAGAVNRLLATRPEASFTWLCREAEHAASAQLLSSAARARTRFLGWTTQERLVEIYDEHGIFLYPPLFDGFGKVFLEAMARGLCVVATRTGGMRDLIQDGISGLQVDFNDPEGIVDRVRRLWDAPDLARSVSARASALACEFSWSRVARETAGFYEHLLALPSNREMSCA